MINMNGLQGSHGSSAIESVADSDVNGSNVEMNDLQKSSSLLTTPEHMMEMFVSAASARGQILYSQRRSRTLGRKVMEEGQDGTLRDLLRSLVKQVSPIKATVEEDKKMRVYDTTILGLCTLGIIIMTIQMCAFWNFNEDTGPVMKDDAPVQVLKILNLCVTGVLYIVMGVQTKLAFALARREWKGLPKKAKLKLSIYFYIRNGLKFLVCAIQPVPFVRIDKICVFMFLRIWAIFPVLRDYHPVFTNRREICKTKRFQLISSADTFSIGTCVKALFFTSPLLCVSLSVIISFCIAGFSVYITERDFHNPSTNINYVYMALITLTTVGYGDYYPLSGYGRAACIVTGFTGIITTALFINMISSHLNLSPLQREATEWTVQKDSIRSIQNQAASFIQLSWKHYMYMKTTKFATVNQKLHARSAHRAHVARRVKKLRSLRRKMMIADMHSEDPVMDKVLSMETHINNLESQNRLLLAKIDHITDLLLQSSPLNPLPFVPPSMPPSRAASRAHMGRVNFADGAA